MAHKTTDKEAVMPKVIEKILLASLIFGIMMENIHASVDLPKRYLISESGIFTSFDPLNADATNNLPAARMLYHTPIEISKNDILTSAVLDSFEYSIGEARAKWIVKKGLKYSDGTEITPEDVLFSVVRMAFTRPKFPVIKEIVGIEEWSSKPGALSALPSGIKLDKQTITITFTRNVDHPLFRFCLELFSIIPKRCVDEKTNKLVCDQPPSSGYFTLKDKGSDWALFQLRHELEGSKGLPKAKQIKFEYHTFPSKRLKKQI